MIRTCETIMLSLRAKLEEPSSIRTSDIDEERVRLMDGSRNIAVLEGRKNAVSTSVLRRE